MKPEIDKLHQVWEQFHKGLLRTELPLVHFDQIVSSVFTAGPSYYYVIDFYDMTLTNVSSSIADIHGLNPTVVTFNDILEMIHPDDIDFVSKAEHKVIHKFREIGWEKLLRYKVNYCFRFKTADGSYKLFLHQALMLTLKEDGVLGKSLNIHTDISNFAKENKHTFSLVSIAGEASYLDIPVTPLAKATNDISFTKRETEIIKLVSEGLTNAQIADKLFIAIDTVKNHRRNMLDKSGLNNSVQLIKKCIVSGLI